MVKLVTTPVASFTVFRVALDKHITDIAGILKVLDKLLALLFVFRMISLIVNSRVSWIGHHTLVSVVK